MKIIDIILFACVAALFLVSCKQQIKSEKEAESNKESLIAQELYSSGIQKQNSGKYAEAVSDFTQIIGLQSNYLKAAYFNRGLCKGRLYDIRGAVSDYDNAITIDSLWAEAYMRRAFAKFELGDTDGGCIDLSKGGELGDTLAYMFMKDKCYDK